MNPEQTAAMIANEIERYRADLLELDRELADREHENLWFLAWLRGRRMQVLHVIDSLRLMLSRVKQEEKWTPTSDETLPGKLCSSRSSSLSRCSHEDASRDHEGSGLVCSRPAVLGAHHRGSGDSGIF